MEPERLTEILDYLGLSTRKLARSEGYEKRGLRRMEHGALPIPDKLGAWLERVMQAAQEHPPESFWTLNEDGTQADDDDNIEADDWLYNLVEIVGDSPLPEQGWFRRPLADRGTNE